MSNENSRNDFIFFQNEILGDVKQMETKLNEKFSQMKKFLDSETQKYDNKIEDLTNRFTLLTEKFNEQSNTLKIEESIKKSRQKLEELLTKIEIKLNILDKDFHNSCFKYDKIVTNNLLVPGLIGTSCPYDTLKPFLEYTNQKLNELMKYKEKQTIDTKKYKEKMESIISQNKIQFEISQNKINDYCSTGFNQCDIVCKDRANLLEKRIETLRVENGEFSYNLQKKADELKIQWDKVNEIEIRLNKKFKEELNKFNGIIDKITNKFDKNKEEFYLIKNKFTELSEFIKDVRFRKNMNTLSDKTDMNEREVTVERRIYREMSNKFDFSKKHKIKKIQNYEKEKNINDNSVLGPNDNYKINSNRKNYKEIDNEKGIENDNNSFDNKSSINEITDNYNNKENIINKKQKEARFSVNVNDKSNQNIKKIFNQNKLSNINKLFNEKKLKISETNPNILNNINDNSINNNSDIIKSKDNLNKNDIKFYKTDKRKDNINKSISIKRSYNNIYNLVNNDNNINHSTYINFNNRYRNENSTQNKKNNYNNLEKNNVMNDNKESIKNLLFLNENAKINDLILGANFNNKINTPSYNLSQAYLMLRKRNEEFQKIRKIRGGISEKKFSQLSPSYIISQSRNLCTNLNLKLFSQKDVKNYNIEDLYYSSFRKDKQKNLELNPNINFNLTNQDYLYINSEKTNFPSITKNRISPKNEKLPNNIIVESNTVNINDNNFDNNFPTQKEGISNNNKKLVYSSSDRNLPANLNPIFPNYKEYFSNDNESTNEKNEKYY
jgi:hypothetical protein